MYHLIISELAIRLLRATVLTYRQKKSNIALSQAKSLTYLPSSPDTGVVAALSYLSKYLIYSVVKRSDNANSLHASYHVVELRAIAPFFVIAILFRHRMTEGTHHSTK